MTLLDAYNLILTGTGYPAVSDVDERSMAVAQAGPCLEAARRKVLLEGYKFNIHTTTLTPDEDDQIEIPDSYLTVRVSPANAEAIVIFNGKLYDRQTQTYWAVPIEVEIVLDVDFEQIPQPFQEYIAARAAVDFKIRSDNQSDAQYGHLMMEATKAKRNAINTETYTQNSHMPWVAIQRGYQA